MGRLTRDPEVRWSGETCVAKYAVAVDRRSNRDSEQKADYPNCVAFGKLGEFAEKYLRKGTKVAIVGRIQTGSYKKADGSTVYTTDVVVEECEFAESKNSNQNSEPSRPKAHEDSNGFMTLADCDQEELPFN